MLLPDWFTCRANDGLSGRTALKLGVAAVLGLSFPECLAAASGKLKLAARNVLVICEQGEMSRLTIGSRASVTAWRLG